MIYGCRVAEPVHTRAKWNTVRYARHLSSPVWQTTPRLRRSTWIIVRFLPDTRNPRESPILFLSPAVIRDLGFSREPDNFTRNDRPLWPDFSRNPRNSWYDINKRVLIKRFVIIARGDAWRSQIAGHLRRAKKCPIFGNLLKDCCAYSSALLHSSYLVNI